MKIIGFSINKVLIESKSSAKGKLEIKSGLSLSDIKEESLGISEKSSLRFEFVYTVDYEPNVAKVEIKGAVIALDEKNESKDILKEWKQKKLNNNLRLPLFNFILNKCNLKALQLEDEIGLPLHLPMPKFGLAPNAENSESKNQSKDSKDKKAKEKEKNPANYAG